MGNDADRRIRLMMVGCGGMARHHVRNILQQQDTTEIVLACEPSPANYQLLCELFEEHGAEAPPNEIDLNEALDRYGEQLDAAFIITPHVFHHDQAKACLEAGLDVLLEKPMVMNVAEAESLIKTRDATGRLLSVAFNGSLSPQIRAAVELLRSGELGEMLNIHAVAWQGWREATVGQWRQSPELAGGGFMFDTGAHLLNTVSDLVGEDFTQVTAWLDNRGAPVDILGTVMARTKSGTLVTLTGCGDTFKTCESEVRVFCTDGILLTGVWGETLEIERDPEEGFVPVPVPDSLGAWAQFVRVRADEIDNPSPPEIGLRMAKLWDAIRASAAQDGQMIHLS